MFSSKGGLWVPHWRKTLSFVLVLIPASLYLYDTYHTARQRDAVKASSHQKINFNQSTVDDYPTVNLVVASLLKDDISWTQNVPIPNLNIIRYVSDYLDAEFHPPVAKKGREALIYHTYMHDFYDDLPDISIMIHADETSWHVEDVLNASMTFALSHLDLDQVLERQYFNLRVSWEGACPDWINTTFLDEQDDVHKLEEPYMHEAFSENFATNKVPEILGGPCCSQFAVTKDAVKRHPQSQYRQNMDWLVQTDWNDYIAGRVWEHMWPFLFRGEAVDCAIEWKAYCRMYHICFNVRSRELVDSMAKEKKELEAKIHILKEVLDPQGGLAARKRMEEIAVTLQIELERALERGRNQTLRMEILSDLDTS
ncbi:Uu.00g098370.m01.CDS01 [Anthostomella pinea]|uniref:Uu.00g098370.m01.CDS01 n=1 Tax=Anthostomella pinea TaxID=933095 RepID=A0AAI8YF92_9PEZI|nr:Uu.00g098370.m01.CDS01 [Anthostomella pinea]